MFVRDDEKVFLNSGVVQVDKTMFLQKEKMKVAAGEPAPRLIHREAVDGHPLPIELGKDDRPIAFDRLARSFEHGGLEAFDVDLHEPDRRPTARDVIEPAHGYFDVAGR